MKTYKNFFTSLVITILFSITSSFGQTTQEEYNYITKGYKVQLESGLDMKKGYSFKDMGNSTVTSGSEKRTTEFKALLKEGQSKPAAIMMIYKRTDIANGAVIYVCIPSPDAPKEIWQQTMDFISTNFKNNDVMLQTVIWGLMKFGSKEASI
ncbi:MAG: hypothetical protein LDL23_11350 [Flavobacterium sp.]|uniref:hypothetical protein n=1 Tax=Flavobacterium sp. TaxID=239 RepID=UPI0025BE748E|nr:hypothetical protein [Flavobacterium sp.]MCA1967230.1 hypothetical protein [Flavobacterium sp.]